MRHRHRPEFKPTDRLVLAALAITTVPLSVAELSEATGSAPTTLIRPTRVLAKGGLIVRHRIGGLSNYSLPHPDTYICERAFGTNNALIQTRVGDLLNLALATAVTDSTTRVAVTQ